MVAVFMEPGADWRRAGPMGCTPRAGAPAQPREAEMNGLLTGVELQATLGEYRVRPTCAFDIGGNEWGR